MRFRNITDAIWFMCLQFTINQPAVNTINGIIPWQVIPAALRMWSRTHAN